MQTAQSIQAARFACAPTSPSMADPSNPGVLVNARFELLRALDLGTDGDLVNWARRYGEGFLRFVEERDGEIELLEEQLAEEKQEAKDAEAVDTDDLATALTDAEKHVCEARSIAKSLPVVADDLAKALDLAKAAISNAAQECGRL